MLGSEPSQQCENFFGIIVIQSKLQPTPLFLPGKSHGWRNLVGYSAWGRKESDTTERHLLYFYFSLCVTHLSDMGFDFIIIVLLRLLCLWTSGIFFLVGSSVLLSIIVQQLVTVLVLSQEEMSVYPSPPS